MFALVLQRILLEAFLDIFYFPLWWYTAGARHTLVWCYHIFQNGNRTLAPGLWLKNIFIPMFGQYDWQGRVISFFMRSAQVFARFLALLVWLIICTVLFFIWMVLPFVVVYGLFLALIKK